MKLSGPRAFRPVVTVVAVVIAPFFVAIIIAMWSGGRSSAEPLGTWSGGLVVGARRSRSGHGLVVWWSELGGEARDVVDVVGARRGRSGRGRCGRNSAWLA